MRILRFSPRQKAIVASVIFFVLLSFFVAGGLDASYVVFNKNNIIAAIGELFGFPKIEPAIGGYIILLFLGLYLIAGSIALFAVINKVKEDGKTLRDSGLLLYMILIGVAGFIVFIGVGMLFSIPNGAEGVALHLQFVGQSLLISLLAFACIYAIVFAIYLLILSLPFASRPSIPASGAAAPKGEETEEKKDPSEDDVTASFDSKKGEGGAVAIGGALVSGGASAPVSYDRERVFPELSKIDSRFVLGEQSLALSKQGLSLKRIVAELQNYLATSCSLYYSLEDLAMFASSLLTAPITILEGVSGTGKSSLPRYFAKFIGETAYFESVQMTYKDRDDILGYYNDFTGVYSETEFLKRLYESTYRLSHLNIMVLDEMNISRIEYYFADFLSVLEFPEGERKIHLYNIPGEAPAHLGEGDLALTPNTRFVGTANTDDSTFAITDKVIDRAVVLDFDEFHEPIEFETKAKPTPLSYQELNSLALEARKDRKLSLSSAEMKKLSDLLRKAGELLDVKTGNRFLNQAKDLTPCYAAMTGEKEGALDYLFAFKVLRKAKGRVDASYRGGLHELSSYIKKTYGDSFKRSLSCIDYEIRRLG